METQKLVIYQLFPRLFGNKSTNLIVNGGRDENGCGKLNDINDIALSELKKMGVTHVWLTGVIEHAIVKGYPANGIEDGNPLLIKGNAGSPYAIKDYYDVNPDLATDVSERLTEFKELVKRCHAQGLKVIIDFVPNHLAREYKSDMKPEYIDDFGVHDDHSKAFSANNNFYYLPSSTLQLPTELTQRFPECNYEETPAKVTGNDRFVAEPDVNDWYETIKLNYGVDYENGGTKHFDPIPDTWLKMKDVLSYWNSLGVDGFRCDMVEMVPVEFWAWLIPQIKQISPWMCFIAEVYNPKLYQSYIQCGGFDYLYDKVGLYDTLRSVMCHNKSATAISECWQNLQGIDKNMLRFLENHDEQRIASHHFVGQPQRAIPAMALSTFLHQGPVMLYNGQEHGEQAVGISGFSGDDGRTTIFDYWNMPEHQKWMNNGAFDGALLSDEHKQLRQAYADMFKYAQLPAIRDGLFYDVMWQNNDVGLFNKHRCYAFIRYSSTQQLLIICNFDDTSQHVHLKIPSDALQILDIPRPILVRFANIADQQLSSIGSEELINDGLKLIIPAFGYQILDISS
ncbi:alpha-amylase family glycosyl hydrolase [Carboxylicivirga sp. M1479]|uniref:alpha-amylase family glycosyl hydrolase n=1 Tax=Carboxylicivirga sp. M1479 TaxID=2594476 RepID=UPI001177D8A6|nr:alpha-amylase family glycosyl hydrolase [Carboxylicivirga sp. M1479]TRX62511.1 alpha-amylase [Carboxylicivirga sp. M1479]